MSDPHMVQGARVRKSDASMLRAARRAVFEASDWLTAEQVTRIACPDASGSSVRPDCWNAEGQIFSVRYVQQDYFPAYGLNPERQFRPVAALADVLRVFDSTKDGWHLAYWFASVNSYLDGKRPLDLLATEPGRVIVAAQEEARGVWHG
ncbi:antitoxin Xre/MbcA/ParS toxin-binding domain-containing protein [Paraburkholderia guartelaensis]|uniref:antitoxin Xre/MbcA/ParS toxin-binding domain-containing protein n=1 Tax=Paraburkholderia guartelaensis TaxID=2546446 RepID=UPI002AB680DA|nr:antitoxin Xre/MbcA/ParS toxin-binding domain-containing protein [Paraburkholderia guartelaensis]